MHWSTFVFRWPQPWTFKAVSDIVSCSGLTRAFRTSLTRAKQTRWVYGFHRMITVENHLVFW
jgi:hypothetical protein